jgi:hypothetical protein
MDWLTELASEDDNGNARYSADTLTAINADPASPHLKASAAAMLLRMRQSGHARNGLPLANADLERLLDRTLGKPKAQVEVTSKKQVTLTDVNRLRAELLADLRDMVAANPEEARRLGLLDSSQPGTLPPGSADAGGAGAPDLTPVNGVACERDDKGVGPPNGGGAAGGHSPPIIQQNEPDDG